MKAWFQVLGACAGTILLAQSASGATQFKIGDGAADAGGAGTVGVSLQSDLNPVALQFDLLYDASLINAGSPALRDGMGKYVLAASNPAVGVQRVLLYSLSNLPLTNGILIDLSFTPRSGSPGQTVALRATNVVVAAANSTAILPLDIAPGSFATSAEKGARFTTITKLSDSLVELQLSATVGRSFTVQFSPNLKDWTAFSTNTIPTGGLLKLNAPVPAKTGNRFFRAARP